MNLSDIFWNSQFNYDDTIGYFYPDDVFNKYNGK